MDVNKIMSADLLDIVFDDRNKAYGAYDLRKTYNSRLTRALLITASLALLLILGSYQGEWVQTETRLSLATASACAIHSDFTRRTTKTNAASRAATDA